MRSAAPHPTRRPHLLVLLGAVVLTLVVVSLGSVNAFHKIESFQPLGFQAQRSAGGYLVTAVLDTDCALEVGDHLVLVAGESPAGAAELRSRLTSSESTPLALLRGEQLVEVVYERPPLQIDGKYLVLAASGLIYLALGLYVLFQSRRRPAGLFFLWATTSAAVYLLTYPQGGALSDLERATFAVEELARIFLPALTLHLFLLFPRPLLTVHFGRLATLIYLPSLGLAALQADLMLNRGELFFGGLSRGTLQALDQVEIGHLVLFSLLSLAVLVYQLRRSDDWQQRRQLQWIAGGLAAGYLPFLALYVVPWALSLSWPTWTTVAAVVPLSLVPIAFSWAIFRYRLWDVEVILRQAASFAVTLGLGAVAFSLVHLGLSRGVPDESLLTRNLLTFLAGLLIAGVLVPTERGVRSGLERIQSGASFRRRKALSQLGRELLVERDLPVLAGRLLDQLRIGLELERAELLLGRTDSLAPTSTEFGLPRFEVSDFGPEIWERRWHHLTGGALPTAPTSALDQIHRRGFRYLFPLTLQGRPLGLLTTGLKLDGEPLNSEEMALIRALLDQTALAVENAHLMEALRQRLDEVELLKQHSEQILDSSPAGIAVLGGEGVIDNANDAFCRIVGREPGQVLGQPLSEILPFDSLPEPGQALHQLTFVDASGAERHLQASSAAYDERGELEVLVVVDVTEKVEMEQSLKEKERLASLGMLAAGVAHEVNTPITGISSYAQMLLADTPADDPRRELLEKVERQTFRASRIVNNLLEFSRNRKQDQRVLRLDRVVDEAIDILDDKLDHSPVILRKQYPATPVAVLGGEGDLQQVITNLISNAIDAIGPREGRIILGVSETTDGRAQVVVEDDGPGIAAEELDKIFQPFYSTKLSSGGTGLGLSISYQIVRRHGGHLTAESTPGQGTRFLVDLPLHRPVVEETR